MNGDRKEFVLPAKTTLQTIESGPCILSECGGEFVLPDYMPKVQKVLRIEAQVIPPSRYISSNDIQLSGNVLHTLIYTGEDGEVGATVLPSKYELMIPFSASDIAPTAITDIEVDSLTYRLSAPRKLNIRTKLSARAAMIKNQDMIEHQKPTDIPCLHKLYGSADSIETVVLHSQDITVSDTIPVSVTENAHLLWCGSTAVVNDVKVSELGVDVRGETVVKVLLEDNGIIKVFTKKIPFNEFISGDLERVTYAVAMPSVISTEAGKDNDREVLVDVIMTVEVICDTPKKIPILKDAFCEKGSGIIENTKVPIEQLVFSYCGVRNVGASIQKNAAGAEGIISIVDSSGRAVLDDVSSKGKLVISGRCMMNSICKLEDDSITSVEYTLPFKIDFDREINNNVFTITNASLSNARVRMDGDNLVCDMDIFLNVRAIEKGEETTVNSIDYTAPTTYKENTHQLCLVYPNGDSLWELAKKYHVSPESLAKVNSLEISEKDYAEPSMLSHLHSMMLELK